MNDMEKRVWAAAFAAEFVRELNFRNSHVGTGGIDTISGFSCAEIADVALQKYREAIRHDDREHLTPIKEGWV